MAISQQGSAQPERARRRLAAAAGIGYLPFSATAGALLFHLLSRLAGHRCPASGFSGHLI
jgi:hypothetical protein